MGYFKFFRLKRNHIIHVTSVALVVLTILSCSRKKDKFINRNWHAMTTRYNTLYNGDVSFVQGKEGLIESYQDNYWKQLPIERLEVRDEVYLQSQSTNASFEYAEEKAAKAIQKHSMEIKGREKNHQIDEAFMLLGKARYYNQRFIPALEAFNYILYKYPTSNSIDAAKVWKAKTHIRLDNNEGAIKILKRALKMHEIRLIVKDSLGNEMIPVETDSTGSADNGFLKKLKKKKLNIADQDISDATAMLAQAYVNLKQKDSAIGPMKAAIEYTNDNEERGRYHYILGQLYNSIQERDSANLEFDKIIKLNRRTKREYLINAYLAKARNLEIDSDDQLAFLEILNKLEKNRENRPFLDKIYYEKAIFYFAQDSIKLAEDYYERSLRTDTQDEYLRSLSYETLGRIRFNEGKYEKAGFYMDSTLNLLDPNSKRYRVIAKKRDNLDDVILFEGISRTNDSILRIAAMSEEEQFNFYKKYTDSIRAIKVEQLKKQKSLKARSLQNAPLNLAARSRSANSTEEQKFYFYNPITLANGKLQFEQIYGKRKLVENWKISSLNEFNDIAEPIEELEEGYDIETDSTFNPVTYVNKIPTDKKVLDSLGKARNEAYYNLGTVYKEQLKEYDKAADIFETLLGNNPEERFIMPTKYNLYKIYQSTGNVLREENMRRDILKNHPDSRYAKIVKDPFKEVIDDGTSPEDIYTKIYKQYEQQQYAEVLQKLEKRIEQYDGDPVVAKFQLLKALTLGKIYGTSKMTELLNYLAITYPQSDEGQQAQQLLNETVPYLESLSFKADSTGNKKYKLLYDFSSNDSQNAQNLRSKLDTLIKKRNFRYLKTSVDFYSKDTLFVIVHGLKGKGQARGMNSILTDKELEDDRKWYLERDGISVSTDNYRVIQSQKRYSEYLQKRDSIY